MNLRQKIARTIRQHQLIPPHSRVLVAVSGGADLLALLHLLKTLQSELPDEQRFNLHVATLDHGLRGDAGAQDTEFVRQMAGAWGLPVTVGQAKLDPTLPGVEARAREARYHFLAQTAWEAGAGYISVAHHADDQAETVLLHLIRGGGLRGLGGLRYLTPLPAEFDPAASTGRTSLWVIRPLLDVTRAEIEAYCAEQELSYRHDATNDVPDGLRNRLRLQTIPHLRDLNPQISTALHRLARIADDENDWIEQEIHLLTEQHARLEFAPDNRTLIRISLELAHFRELHPALRRRLVLWGSTRLAAKLGADRAGFDHIEAVLNVMQTAVVGVIVRLPGGVQVRAGYEQLYLERINAPENTRDYPYLLPPKSEFIVNITGEIMISEGWHLGAYPLSRDLVNEPAEILEGLRLKLFIPADTAVILRTRQAGDRIAPRGMNGHTRKLKDWLIDRKIPCSVRDHLPLLVIEDKIIAILIESQWQVTELYYQRYNLPTLPGIYINVTVAKT